MFVVNRQAEGAPPLVPFVEIVRPVGGPSVYFETIRPLGEQGSIEPIKIRVGIADPVRRIQKRAAVVQLLRFARRREQFADADLLSPRRDQVISAFPVVFGERLKRLLQRQSMRLAAPAG